MKINHNIKIKVLLTLLVPALALASCKDDVTEVDPSRLFRPVNLKLTTEENTVTATWAGMQGAVSYTVELYRGESVKDDNDVSHTNRMLVAGQDNLRGTSWTVTGLEFSTTYYFRVRANSPEPAFDSRFSGFESIRTQNELQVLTVKELDADNAIVTFEWLTGHDISFIHITGKDFDEEYEVNDAAGELTVRDMPAGVFNARAFSEVNQRFFNTVTFEIPVIKPVAKSDITIEGVTLRWVDTPDLAYIEVVSVNGSDPVTHTYPINGLTERSITLVDLLPFTTYDATIFFADDSPGNTVRFTTLSEPPAGVIVVSTVEELKTQLDNAVNGSTIALNPGTYHFTDQTGALASHTVTKGFTLIPASAEMPLVICKGFIITNTAPLDLIRIDGIAYQGEGIGSGSGYLFDYNGGTANVNRLEIVNCLITDLDNSLLRCDRASTYGVLNVLVDNCEMYNMNAKQCLIAYPSGAGDLWVESVTITNSTITNIGWFTTNTRAFSFLGNKNLVVDISNNTLVINSATNPFIHYRATANGGENNGVIRMEKNIIYNMNVTTTLNTRSPNFGSGATAALTQINNNNVPFPFVSSVSGEVINEDPWSDFNTFTINPGFVQIDGTTRDFTPSNQVVVSGGYGDPRWLK